MGSRFKPGWAAILGGVMTVVLIVTQAALAVVTLVYFRAFPQNGQVLLEWETATEIDNAGFFVNRSLTQQSGYSRISQFIDSEGDDLSGAIYQYYDYDVTNGVTYWYMLEAVNLDQSTEFHQPPVSAVPGSQTPTSTRTATGTVSATPPGTGTRTVTLTPTRTRTPLSTPTMALQTTPSTPTATVVPGYPGPETQVFLSTVASADGEATLFPGEESSGTATLIPLPEITMVFPTQEIALVSRLESDISQANLNKRVTSARSLTLVRGMVLLVVVLFVWALLGGLYFVASRKF